MIITIPDKAEKDRFVIHGLSAHGNRTIMLEIHKLLLSGCQDCLTQDDFRIAILENNLLLKQTDLTRKESFRRLRELNGLSQSDIIFRSLRDLWEQISEAQPLLALCKSSLLWKARLLQQRQMMRLFL